MPFMFLPAAFHWWTLAARTALLLSSFPFRVAAWNAGANAEMDSLAPTESFSNPDKGTFVTAAMSLRRELSKLPQRRMVDRIDTVFRRQRGLSNANSERRWLEQHWALKSARLPWAVQSDIRSKLDAVRKNEMRLGGRGRKARGGVARETPANRI
ncbi:hypothetical protein TRVL_06490 [Trypanosoma vivax]|nr:hypothetical protein TRVL_06490 [Trypanosoma vivax]